MANELSRTYEVDGQEITLNPSSVMRYVLAGQQNVSEPEMAKVIMTCAARKLNPFAGDVNILPHYDKDTGATKLTVAPSKDFYLRRAMANPRFRGIDDGIVVMANGVLAKKRGCAVYEELNEKLIGGWAAVSVEGFERPVFVEVSLREYDQHRALWKTKPGVMINKVAVSQALRKAFPDLFMGTYEPSEMDYDEPKCGEEYLNIQAVIDDVRHESPLDFETDGYEISAGEDEFRCASPVQEMEAF